MKPTTELKANPVLPARLSWIREHSLIWKLPVQSPHATEYTENIKIYISIVCS